MRRSTQIIKALQGYAQYLATSVSVTIPKILVEVQSFTLEEAKKVIDSAKEDFDKLKDINVTDLLKLTASNLTKISSLPALVVDLSRQLSTELLTVANFLKAAYEDYPEFLKDADKAKKSKNPKQAYEMAYGKLPDKAPDGWSDL